LDPKVLVSGARGGHYGRVEENHDPDIASRGQAIFAKLRTESESEQPGQAPASDGVPEAGAIVPPAPPGSSAFASIFSQAESVPADAEPGPGPDAPVERSVEEATAAEEPGGVDAAPVDAAPVEAGGSAPSVPATPAGVGMSSHPLAGLDTLVPPPRDGSDRDDVPSDGEPESRFRRPLPRVLAIANQKGGVGKTTTAVNLGASLAELGFRTLVVDLDPQGNATTGLGINARNLETSVYDVIMHDTPLEDCVEPTSLRNLFVAPATIDLAGAEIELVPAFSRELKLRRALEQLNGDFEFVLIDCPPSLGLITVNGLAAATEVIVPIQCEYYALEGLGQLLRNVSLVQKNLNPPLEVSAIILTMYDARTKLAEQVAAEVRAHFGDRVCRNIVPRTVRLSEAPSFGQPIIVFDPTSRGAIAYRELAKEVSGGAPQRIG